MKTHHKTVIDKFGRILIPKEIRTNFGLTPGSALEIEERGDEITLHPSKEKPLLVKKGSVLVVQIKVEGELAGIEKRLRRERLAEMVRKSGL